jgi:3-oxoacyl-[acyl-carrier-protein] synthase II
MRGNEAVWITGVGAPTPLGNTYAEVADNLLAGKSGVRAVTHFDVSKHQSKIHAPIEPVSVPAGWDEADFASLGLYEQTIFWCATQALQDAGWWERRSEVRLGLAMGFGAEWLRNWEVNRQTGGDRVRDPRQDRESLLALTQRKLGLRGPAVTVAAACASGNHALAQARRWLHLGWADVCLAGACNLDMTPMSMASFGNLGALSRRNAEPTAASRPFDRGRDGFVMGEGGALFVLEKAGRARQRGARPYAEFAGFGASSDASHSVIPSSDPEPAAQAMRVALLDAGVAREDVDYLNAHAPSTPAGDRAEAAVLHRVFGEAIHRVPVSSTKGMTGHLLSAAAAVEALACLVALERQALPPTINLDDPDPECQLCHVPHQARPHAVRVAASNSFGFGGSNSCLVLRKVA